MIFDVRANSGRSSSQGARLAKKTGQAFRGEVYVITGRRTFSSAVLNTLDFQKYCKATLAYPLAGPFFFRRLPCICSIVSFPIPQSKGMAVTTTRAR